MLTEKNVTTKPCTKNAIHQKPSTQLPINCTTLQLNKVYNSTCPGQLTSSTDALHAAPCLVPETADSCSGCSQMEDAVENSLN